MPTPQLVTTQGAPFKIWPGGIIVFRAADWVGSSGATTQADGDSIEGTVVHETQLRTENIRTQELTAFTNAGETLSIPLTGIPVELGSDIYYDVFVSCRILGDWDTTNSESYRGSTPLRFLYTARMGVAGSANYPVSSTNFSLFQPRHYPKNRPHYSMHQLASYGGFSSGGFYFTTGTETLKFKAFGGPGSTIEWLIDQIVLVPSFALNPKQVTYIASDQMSASLVVDGPDGGDINGKFTRYPKSGLDLHSAKHEPYTDATRQDGGGDYQKSDSEYMTRIVPNNNRGGAPSTSPSAYAYSLHGALYRDSEVWETDNFSRTIVLTDPLPWGKTPKGYGWKHLTAFSASNSFMEVDGSRGHMHFAGTVPRDDGICSTGLAGFGAEPNGAEQESAIISAENFMFSGKFMVDQGGNPGVPFWDASTGEVNIRTGITYLSGTSPETIDAGFGFGFEVFGIWIDVINAQWKLRMWNGDVTSYTSLPFFTLGVEIGFRLRVDRYRVRCKLWDASGAEPGAWDVDTFRPIHGWPFAASRTDYPYSDNPAHENAAREMFTFVCGAEGLGYVDQWDAYWDDLQFEFDADGGVSDIHANFESPEGTERGRITIPHGAWHFVYWGRGDWFDLGSFGQRLAFSSKVWSEAGSSSLQRSEAPFWWFRNTGLTGIVPVDWFPEHDDVPSVVGMHG